MTNKDIFLGALALIAEPQGLSAADYEERAPYIIAGFLSENAALDNQYRHAMGEVVKKHRHPAYASLDEEFPLSDRFATPAQFYLASMLISDEDTDRADDLFDRFCTGMTGIMAEIPAVAEKITNAYGF